MYLIVHGETRAKRQNIQVSLEFPPRLDCPEVQTSFIGLREHHVACNIESNPQMPKENITWEILGECTYMRISTTSKQRNKEYKKYKQLDLVSRNVEGIPYDFRLLV